MTKEQADFYDNSITWLDFWVAADLCICIMTLEILHEPLEPFRQFRPTFRYEPSANPADDKPIDEKAWNEAMEQNGEPSSCCGAGMCEHGVCDNFCNNDGEHCKECFRRSCLEADAAAEAAFQRDVAGPLLGFRCTCGPDYYDKFCPLHGTEPPEKKWEK